MLGIVFDRCEVRSTDAAESNKVNPAAIYLYIYICILKIYTTKQTFVFVLQYWVRL